MRITAVQPIKKLYSRNTSYFKNFADVRQRLLPVLYGVEERSNKAWREYSLQLHGVVVQCLHDLVDRSKNVAAFWCAFRILLYVELEHLPRLFDLFHALNAPAPVISSNAVKRKSRLRDWNWKVHTYFCQRISYQPESRFDTGQLSLPIPRWVDAMSTSEMLGVTVWTGGPLIQHPYMSNATCSICVGSVLQHVVQQIHNKSNLSLYL